jgi:hypothetical protein
MARRRHLESVSGEPPEQGGLDLGEDGFRIGRTQHAYADVAHVAWDDRKTALRLIRYITLYVWVRGRKTPYLVQNGFGFLFTAERLLHAGRELCEKTFQARLASYLAPLAKEGAFDYADTTFFRDGKCNHQGRNHDLHTFRIARDGFDWVFSSKLGPTEFRIPADTDADVMRQVFTDELGLDVAR